MYQICGKVKETEKALFFNCIFCPAGRTRTGVTVTPRGRRGAGREERDLCLEDSAQQHPSALPAVCMGFLWEEACQELPAQEPAAGGAGLLPGDTVPVSYPHRQMHKATARGVLQELPITSPPGCPLWHHGMDKRQLGKRAVPGAKHFASGTFSCILFSCFNSISRPE